MSTYRAKHQLRRGAWKYMLTYQADEDELVICTDSWKPCVWLGKHWWEIPGFTLYDHCMTHGLYLPGNGHVLIKSIKNVPGIYKPPFGRTEKIEEIVFAPGELVCNIDTETVHVGDGHTYGGVIII